MPSGSGGLDGLFRRTVGRHRCLSQFASRAPRLRDGRDGVLKNQLLLRAGFQNQRKLIKALDAAQQFGAVHKINRDCYLLSPREIEEAVLDVLWCWL